VPYALPSSGYSIIPGLVKNCAVLGGMLRVLTRGREEERGRSNPGIGFRFGMNILLALFAIRE